MLRRPSRVVALLALFAHASILAPPAQAHNEPIHQAMTDYAYEVLLAGALYSTGSLPRGASDVEDRLRRLAIAGEEPKAVGLNPIRARLSSTHKQSRP